MIELLLSESISKKQWDDYQSWILKPETIPMNIEDDIRKGIVKTVQQVFDTQLESFKCILQYYKQADNYEKIVSEALLYGLMFYANTEGIPFENFYKKFYSLIKEITGAEVQILFDIRLILLCRSRTITRMNRDFNNNLFQSLWQTKMHNMLLEHFKNATHNNPEESDVMRKTINYIWRIEQYCKGEGINSDAENGSRIYKALLLKMLADNNISSIYHEILAKRLVSNDVCPTSFAVKDIFSNIEDIRYVLVKEKEDFKEWAMEKDALPSIDIASEALDSALYYIVPDPFDHIC